MGLQKVGTTISKEIITWIQMGGSKSLLATRPVKINTVGLKYTPKINADTLELSETSNFIKNLYQNHETSQIKIFLNSEKEFFTKFEGSRMGSNPAYWARNNRTGELFYIKTSKGNVLSDKHLESEVSASKLYNLAGIKTPSIQLARLENQELCLLSKYEEGLKIPNNQSVLREAFAADAWLANWDSLITGNTMMKNGKMIKIDNGGALNYRAQGALKTNFDDRVEELITLIDGRNIASSSVYSNMTHPDLVNSFKRVISISDENIRSVVKDKEIANILIGRKTYLRNILNEMEKTPYDGNSLTDYFRKIDQAIQIPQKEYDDIVQNMLAQRRNIVNTVNEGTPVEATLRNIKDNYLGVNGEIREKIWEALAYEDACCDTNNLKILTQKFDKLIKQGYIPKDTVLYRGATPNDFGMKDLKSNEFVKRFYKKGKLFKIPIYPETSLNKEVGKFFAANNILFKIHVPKGTQGIYMEKLAWAKSGAYANEEEILLPRNLVYKFKSHAQENGYELIEIDIVRSKPFWKKIHEFWTET